MPTRHTVLLYGATGRTGSRVLTALLDRGVAVRAIVRDAARLPDGAAEHPLLTVVQADLLGLSSYDLGRHLHGCDTVVSCLGHTISVRGVLGPPYRLVTEAVARTHAAAQSAQQATPIRLILMSSVSVNRPDHADTGRGSGERAFLAATRAVVPPARDNQRAADYLVHNVRPENGRMEWVVVRPDTLKPGDATQYRTTPETVATLFRPDHTRMANIAAFMSALATDTQQWERWRFSMPVITDADPADADAIPAAPNPRGTDGQH